jgi:hypothetical protein
MRSFDCWACCWEPQLSKKYGVDRAYPDILGSTIFKFFKSCLGGFRRNLLIVSWVTPTPGCKANFPGNRISQPLILRPCGRSGQEAIDRGQDLGISGNPLSKQRFHSDSTSTKIIRKSHRKKTHFLCVYPSLFWDRIWIRLRIRRRLVKEFFKKNSKIGEVIEGGIFIDFGCNNYTTYSCTKILFACPPLYWYTNPHLCDTAVLVLNLVGTQYVLNLVLAPTEEA